MSDDSKAIRLNPALKIIVTRPAQQAGAWLEALQAAGYSAKQLGLIDIAPAGSAADAAAWVEACQNIGASQAIMFVSSNAVDHFFKPNRPLPVINRAQSAIDLIVNNESKPRPSIRCWATGPGTVRSLLEAGVRSQQIDAPAHEVGQFDSEALWHIVQDQVKPGGQVLMVRGRDVDSPDSSRDWLAQRIAGRGARVDSLVVYERRAPLLDAAQKAQCQSWLLDGSAWLFSSSLAVQHLPAELDASKGICICTHERIAATAKARGFAVVCTSRPTMQDVLASIKSLHE